MSKVKSVFDPALLITVFVASVVAEAIGIIKIPIAGGSIMFLPLLYSMAFGLILYLMKSVPFINETQVPAAEKFIVIGISIFTAKIGIQSGGAIEQVIQAGPALILQEFGNLGTILIALPLALLLGFKRETVGMTHSIGREPNVALVADIYGLNSPEGRGIMIVYIVGTLIGTIFIGMIASLLATMTPLHPLSLAMACGVGSGSMMAASSGALIGTFPEMADKIGAFAGISNLLSTASGLYMSIFIGLPIANVLYRKLEPTLGRMTQAGRDAAAAIESAAAFPEKEVAEVAEEAAALAETDAQADILHKQADGGKNQGE